MVTIDYQDNLCIDVPSSNDYDAWEFQEMAMGTDVIKFPQDKVIVWDQWNVWACTRFWLTHLNNGQNVLEYERNWQEYKQLNPMDERNKSNKVLSLQDALTQFKTEWLIEGYVRIDRFPKDKPTAILQMKQAIDMGHFVYTGSDNWNWQATWKKPYIYTLRTDGKIVGHAWSIIAYDDEKQLFKVINSWWPTWGDKWYFYLPYELIDKIFSKYCIIDKDNSWVFTKFKNQQQASQLVNACSDFWKKELDSGTQQMLHNLAERLRQEYNVI